MADEVSNPSIDDERKVTARSAVTMNASCVCELWDLNQGPDGNLAGGSPRRDAALLAVRVSVPSKKPSRGSEWLGKHERSASSAVQLAQRRTEMKAMFPWTALRFPGVVIRTGAHQTPSTHRPTGILVRLRHGAGHRKVLADRSIRSRGRHPTVD